MQSKILLRNLASQLRLQRAARAEIEADRDDLAQILIRPGMSGRRGSEGERRKCGGGDGCFQHVRVPSFLDQVLMALVRRAFKRQSGGMVAALAVAVDLAALKRAIAAP